MISLTPLGCSTPAFIVKEVDNRFSENKNQLFVSENNRVSTRSIAGGIHIDNNGVYIDPFVEKDLSTGEPVVLGFNLVNKTNYDTLMGDPNSLGTIEKIVFRFSNGELVSLPTIPGGTQSADTITYNRLGGYAGYDRWETAVAMLGTDEYDRIADADSVAVQIIGSRRSTIYETEDIAPAFLTNLRQFRNSYIR